MKKKTVKTPPELSSDSAADESQKDIVDTPPPKPVEVGGPKGPEPTRYGDWEKAGRCSDF
jgi:hypothetical protein